MPKILILAAVLFCTTTVFAFDLMGGLTPPGKQRTILNYSGLLHGNAEFPAGDATTSFQRLNFSTPIYKTDTESVSASVNATQFSVRPTQGNFSELYDLQFGLGFTKALDEQRLWSVSARYGSASDRPFADATVSTLGATAFYSYPSDETGRWLLLVDYSNNRPILNEIPLPGFAYFYTPSKNFRGVFGAPFVSINWGFADNWSLDAFTLVPWVLKSSVSYKITEFAKVYGGFDFSQVTYYLHGRTNREDRLFYDEKKIFLGIKSPLSRSIMAEFEAGHAFDRRFFISKNFQRNPDNPTEISNAPYAKLSLMFLL